MNIAVIGPGNMGSGLGTIWAGKGHHVCFTFSRDPGKLKALAASVPNARAAGLAEAVNESEIVLLSVRWGNVKEAIEAAGPLAGKIIIDCTNPIRPDFNGLAIGFGTSAAEEIARWSQGAHVVKAFNTAFAEIYHAQSRLFGSRKPAMFYCGDHADAKSLVERLIRETGFDPVDAGPLLTARYLEPLAMLMVQLGYGQGMGPNIALSLIMR